MNGITPDNLRKAGWVESGYIDGNIILWRKNINGEWFDLYYSDFDEDYMLTKHIAIVDNMKELNELTINHIITDTVNIQDCNPKKQTCVLTNHGIVTDVVFK